MVLDALVEDQGDREQAAVVADERAVDEGRGRERGDEMLALLGLDGLALDGGPVVPAPEAIADRDEAEREALRRRAGEHAERVLDLRVDVLTRTHGVRTVVGVGVVQIAVVQIAVVQIVEPLEVFVLVVERVEAFAAGGRLLAVGDGHGERRERHALDAVDVVLLREHHAEPMGVGERLLGQHVVGRDQQDDDVVGVSEALPKGLCDLRLLLEAARRQLLGTGIGHDPRDPHGRRQRDEPDHTQDQPPPFGDELGDTVEEALHRDESLR